MTAPAGQYVQNVPIVTITNYKQFKDAFIKRFHYIHAVVQLHQLNASKQNLGEDPRDYSACLQKISDDLFSDMFSDPTQKDLAIVMYECQTKGQFSAGLKDPTGQSQVQGPCYLWYAVQENCV